ncbi:MAG: tyrosine-type recombinase/integrase [Nitrososphaeraceae archaeon]|nr:tyrosine-type recombinase/integrase [Nitrososphaeraceae archaeon]
MTTPQGFQENSKIPWAPEATRESYYYAITGFMHYLGISNKNDYSELLVNGQQPKLIQSQVIDYIMYLRNSKKASSSKINIVFHAIKHFYKTVVELEDINWDKIARFKGENKTTIEKRPYTKDEIYKLLNAAADLRDKAMILVAASSGLRRDAIRSLRIGDLKLIEKYNLYQLTVYPKTEQQYIAFCTPEATKAINEYLEWRKRRGESFNNESPLFRKQFNNRDLLKIRAPAQFLTLKAMDFIINKLLDKTGIRPSHKLTEGKKIPDKTEIAQWHSFRYFYDTTLTFAGVS